jgi:hypothetical protein
MAIEPGEATAPNSVEAAMAALGGGTTSPKYHGGSAMDVGNDLGRGPGTPGGFGTGASGMRPSNIGVGGGGYGDEDLHLILRGMPPERIAEIQRKMQTIGLLPTRFKSFGFVDNTMRSGFAELLGVANMRDSNYTTVLDSLMAAGSGALAEERKNLARLQFGTSLNTYEQSDPASIRQAAEAAFREALGRKPKESETKQFLDRFLAVERGEQAKVFNARDRLEAADRDRAMAGIDAEMGGAPASESDELWQRVQRMIADSPFPITPGKRSRSYEEQVRLWNKFKSGEGAQAARPGTSRHGDGRANDLQYSSPKAREWALANAHKYGLSMPLYDPKLPRSKDESWHVELGAGVHQGIPAPRAGEVAPISEDVTVQRQDLGAQALEFARDENPVETAAYDIGGQFQNFLAILQKGVV